MFHIKEKLRMQLELELQLTLRWRIIMDYPSESNVIRGSLKLQEESQRESDKGRCYHERRAQRDEMLLIY